MMKKIKLKIKTIFFPFNSWMKIKMCSEIKLMINTHSIAEQLAKKSSSPQVVVSLEVLSSTKWKQT